MITNNRLEGISAEELQDVVGGKCYQLVNLEKWGVVISIEIGDCPMG